jgi:hypothetical protein
VIGSNKGGLGLHVQAGLIEERQQALEGPAQDIYEMDELRVGAHHSYVDLAALEASQSPLSV